MGRFYKRFIEPRQQDEDTRSRERVLNVLTAGTIVLFGVGFAMLLASLAAHNFFVLTRAIFVGLGLVVAVATYRLSRTGRYGVAAVMLIVLYGVVATGIAYRWGVTIPPGILLFGMVLVLSGILLGSKYIPAAAVGVFLDLSILHAQQANGTIKADWASWANAPLSVGTLYGCFLIFAIMALISWLYTSQMERSLKRAQRAEKALTRQKELLEVTVERRTRQLQDAQLERVQQMYRFAELGQLSTALLHDLANHLTTLSLDIEGLEEQNRSQMLHRAKRSIRYIDEMVARVRDQLHGRADVRPFNVAGEIDEIVTIMNHRAADARVRLVWEQPANKKELRVRGEPIRFRQLAANLVSNAIDAYPPAAENDDTPRDVLITATADSKFITITVNDWGRGIPKADRDKLFEPFFSTKKTGMGMGLFIARQIVEEHFGGSLTLDAKKKHTAFIVTLARD